MSTSNYTSLLTETRKIVVIDDMDCDPLSIPDLSTFRKRIVTFVDNEESDSVDLYTLIGSIISVPNMHSLHMMRSLSIKVQKSGSTEMHDISLPLIRVFECSSVTCVLWGKLISGYELEMLRDYLSNFNSFARPPIEFITMSDDEWKIHKKSIFKKYEEIISGTV